MKNTFNTANKSTKNSKKAYRYLLYFNIFFVSLVSCKQNTTQTDIHNSEQHNDATKEIKQQKIYTCPMHPSVQRNEPGKCPICGMDLVLKEDDSTSNNTSSGTVNIHSEVSISQEGINRTNITTTKPIIGDIEEYFTAFGKVAIDEKLLKVVSARVSGRTDKLYKKTTGEYVKIGEPLIEVYSNMLLSAQKEYISARDMSSYTKSENNETPDSKQISKIADSALKKLEILGLNKKQLLDLSNRQTPFLTTTMYAPINGTIIEKEVIEGAYFEEGMPLFKIADLSNLWIIANVNEKDLKFIKKGMSVENNFISGIKSISSSIDFIYPEIDGETKTQAVRIPISNTNGNIAVGMTVESKFFIQKSDVLKIPSSALIRMGNDDRVYIELAKGKYQLKEVKTGIREDSWVEVLAGLTLDDNIVSSGAFLIDSQSQITGISSHSKHTSDNTNNDTNNNTLANTKNKETNISIDHKEHDKETQEIDHSNHSNHNNHNDQSDHSKHNKESNSASDQVDHSNHINHATQNNEHSNHINK